MDATAAAAEDNADAATRDIAEGGGVRSFDVALLDGADVGVTVSDEDDDALDCDMDSLRPALVILLDVPFRDPALGVKTGTEGDGSRVILRQLLCWYESSSSKSL
jgi:hypothetical protein